MAETRAPARLTADEEFAAELDTLGAEALRVRDYEACNYLWEASDWHAEPSEAVRTARIMLLTAAMKAESERAEAGR